MKKNFINEYYKYIGESEEQIANRADSLKAQYANKPEINQQDIIDLLNVAVVDELLAAFNYFSSFALSKSEGKEDFDPEFHAHYTEELGHAEDLVRRINELNGQAMQINIEDYLKLNSVGESWHQQIQQSSMDILTNRKNEEISAISFYKFVLICIERMKNESKNMNWDSTTESLIKKILADEEEHLYDLSALEKQYQKDVEI